MDVHTPGAHRPDSTGRRGDDGDVTSEEQMRTALQAYIDGFNAHDGSALASLFADDARIEDPVGGSTIVE